MGVSQSNNRRRNHNWNAYYSYPSSSSYSYYSSDPPYHPHPPPPFPFPPHLLPPPPPPPPSYSYPSTCHCTNPVVGRSVFTPYHNNDWSASYLPPPHHQVVGMVTPSPYVETQQAKKVKSGVNVHKDSLKLEIDEQNPDHHLVSFVFDALFDGNNYATDPRANKGQNHYKSNSIETSVKDPIEFGSEV